jgi:Protein of unknown function (DUF4236)
MGLRFQRRIQIARGFRLNLSKSGVGLGIGRNGLRLGIDSTGKKYFSIGLPGTGLSYREFFGRRITSEVLKKIVGIVAVLVLLSALIMLTIELRH